MASITSLMNSNYNTSSIYGNRNVLSGLASGMDTESMIENAVSGIKLRIENLMKQRTKVGWQQEAYRSIIDKAVDFNTKYTSYSSKTNLLSPSFFTTAVNTTASGTYADKITASGKTSSDIKINAVKQMATAATYTVSALGGKNPYVDGDGDPIGFTAGGEFNLGGTTTVSNVAGSLTFQYGGSNGTTFDIKFDELEDWDQYEGRTNSEKLANAIQSKLSEITYSYTKNGFQETTTADKAVKVNVDSAGNISFSDGLGNGNKVSIGSISDGLSRTLGVKKDATSISNKVVNSMRLDRDVDTKNYLKDKSLTINYNGTSKTISMNDVLGRLDLDTAGNDDFKDALQAEVDKAFGANKISVEYGWQEDGKLTFRPSDYHKGDTISVSGSAVKTLGFENGDGNYVNTGKKLSELMGDDIFSDKNKLAAVGSVRLSSDGKYSIDDAGNRVSRGDDGKYYRVDSDGKFLYNFEINGANINVTKDTTMESLMNSINANPNAGVKVSYSKLTNEFKFTATETGSNSKIELGGLAQDIFGVPEGSISDKFADIYGLNLDDGETTEITFGMVKGGSITLDVTKDTTVEELAEQLNYTFKFLGYKASVNEYTGQLEVTNESGGSVDIAITMDGEELEPVKSNYSYTRGRDAIMDVEINGTRIENLTRSSNSFDLDGLTVNVKGTFEAKPKEADGDYEPITFTTTTDSDKIVDAIKQFVEDYNAMATELKGAYSTMPAQQTNGARYEPLTSDQMNGMSESEIKAYEEKAKQGILFGDSTLSSFYSRLLSAITPGGSDGQALREIGIGTSYSNGMTTLSLDEDKLRAALESNPDKVKDAFTKTREGGASSDGLMQTLQNTLNTYTKTTGEPKGVLIVRAGSIKAPTTLNNNSLQTQMNSIDSQIERWQNKMSDQIDRYTSQFSRLEQLIAQMNSQASAFAGLMGGDAGY